MFSQFPFLSSSDIRPANAELFIRLAEGDYHAVLTSAVARWLFLSSFPSATSSDIPATDSQPTASRDDQPALHNDAQPSAPWPSAFQTRLDSLLASETEAEDTREALFLVGLAALQAFLQSNVTGPPLTWRAAEVCFPSGLTSSSSSLQALRKDLATILTVDGSAVYALTPDVELFYVAKQLLGGAALVIAGEERRMGGDSGKGGLQGEGRRTIAVAWARLRVTCWHQRLLGEPAQSLQDEIYEDLGWLDRVVLDGKGRGVLVRGQDGDEFDRSAFLLEKAAVETFHGFDARAREDLEKAGKARGFEYILTGKLGKRTKFQEQEISQLVVLAKSRDGGGVESGGENGVQERADGVAKMEGKEKAPTNLDLNNDTLLESIAYSKTKSAADSKDDQVPQALTGLDPSKQPLLHPLDSIILLSLASSITNTSPEDGLTREETLPYATRVLESGSSNWQVYTQALLVRSRIEGYRSRTVERGVLQLQALVDQVIADTTGPSEINPHGDAPTIFLPRPKASESAPVTERLLYINQLATPPRWALEAELAARWVNLGGLRTALEIYERLEMWAEVALCWAATDREDKAMHIIRKQLFFPTQPQPVAAAGATPADEERDEDTVKYTGAERAPLPADAPRLFCILADLEKDPAHYERAWSVSKQRYARAQRLLGKHYLAAGDLAGADEAYAKSLAINHQNAGTWFALGCVRLSTESWSGAVHAFSRSLQIEEQDGEAWSNLAAALLQLPAPSSSEPPSQPGPSSTSDPGNKSTPIDNQADTLHEDGEEVQSQSSPEADTQKYTKQAFAALRRASALKRDSYRIWQNVLAVAARLRPPPYYDIIVAQTRLIELRSKSEGEGSIDVAILEGVLRHVIALGNASGITTTSTAPSSHGLEKMLATLLRDSVIPLITHSRRLWQLVARFAIYQKRPGAALDAYEKAWRAVLNSQPGWEGGGSVNGGGGAEVSEGEGGSGVSEPPDVLAWRTVVEATEELVDAYESLGERVQEKEKEGDEGGEEGGLEGKGLKAVAEAAATAEDGEGKREKGEVLVCPNWRYKARMAIRGVLGRRTKAGLEEGEEGERLRQRMEGLKVVKGG